MDRGACGACAVAERELAVERGSRQGAFQHWDREVPVYIVYTNLKSAVRSNITTARLAGDLGGREGDEATGLKQRPPQTDLVGSSSWSIPSFVKRLDSKENMHKYLEL